MKNLKETVFYKIYIEMELLIRDSYIETDETSLIRISVRDIIIMQIWEPLVFDLFNTERR